MKCNVLSVLLMIISPVVWADSNDMPVDLGSQTLRVSQPVNSEFAVKNVTIPAMCTSNCDGAIVTWTPLARYRETKEKGVYLFDSGIKGIAIQISTEKMDIQPSAGRSVSFTAGLVRTSQDVGSTAILSVPLLQWQLKAEKNGQDVLKQGRVVVRGNLTTGSCVLNQKDLVFKLKPVDIRQIKNTSQGAPVTASGDQQFISVDCIPGVADSLDMSFKALTVEGANYIMKATSGNSHRVGVGFIFKGGDAEKDTISWDGTPVNVSVPAESGQLRYPLTAYLTPVPDGTIEADDFTGSASFEINYH